MAENDNETPADFGDIAEPENGVFRWMSAFVVLLAVAGFFGLAWYAYKSGGEAVDEKDVELVKADKTQIKETPANPGGMQIPNQDKTVYGLIGGRAEKPTVERILPAPEEPLSRGSDTETWMSDKVKNKAGGVEEQPQQVAQAVPAVVPITPPVPVTVTEEKGATLQKAEQFNPEKLRTVDATSQAQDEAPEIIVKPEVAFATPLAAPSPPPAPVKVAAPVTPKAPAAGVLAATPVMPKVAAKPSGGARVQLGAYGSEEEAQDNWKHIAKKFSDETKGKEHYVVRADLGEKGVFYRLQLAPFASSKEAEQFCLTFVSAGQGCFLAKAK